MAWIYLAASEATLSHSESGLKPLLTVNKTDTLSLSCFHGWQTKALNQRQSGMTLQPLADQCLIPQSTLCLGDFPAKTSHVQAMELAWQESEAVFFSRSCAWPNKSSPLFYSLKMSQTSEQKEWTQLSKNLPKSGMTVDGLCYPLQKLERRTKEKDGFCWLTPKSSAVEEKYKTYIARMKRSKDPKVNTKKNCGNLSQQIGGPVNPTWCEWLMGFPLEWTALNDLGTQWYHYKRKPHLNI
jgi:hypothetical protein